MVQLYCIRQMGPYGIGIMKERVRLLVALIKM